MSPLVRCLVSVLLSLDGVAANDPPGGWLSFAKYTAPKPADIITKMSMDMVVPSLPKKRGGSPAFVSTDRADSSARVGVNAEIECLCLPSLLMYV